MPDARLPERLRAKIVVNPATGCWEWTACRTTTGYGRVRNGQKSVWAHRLVYEALLGPIQPGLVIDHLCRVRHCVNPAHMEPVTDRENTLRGDNADVTRVRHRAKRLCHRGHPLYGDNVRRRDGSRHCVACGHMYAAAYRARNLETIRAQDRERHRRADVLLELLGGQPWTP